MFRCGQRCFYTKNIFCAPGLSVGESSDLPEHVDTKTYPTAFRQPYNQTDKYPAWKVSRRMRAFYGYSASNVAPQALERGPYLRRKVVARGWQSQSETRLEKKYFVFRGIDHADSLWMREQFLEQHRAYVRRPGPVKLVHGGPLYDDAGQPVGSCLIVEADSRTDAEAWLSTEPFFKSGLFAITSTERWGWTYGR